MSNRVSVTILLPASQAETLLHAAKCAALLDDQGRVVMDHFILARDPRPLEGVLDPPLKQVQTFFEAEFNGA